LGATSRVPGISAFGTKVAFYEYMPVMELREPFILTPCLSFCPVDMIREEEVFLAEERWWRDDVMEVDGFAKLRQKVQEVIQMCSVLDK